MNTYTVFGFYPESNQRWASSYEAVGPDAAEDLARAEHPDVAIVAVILGDHQALEEATYVNYP